MAPRSTTPRFHVIIVPWIRPDYLEACLAAVMAQSLPPAVVSVFDNTMASGVADLVGRGFPQARLMRSPRDLGFAAGNNRAAAGVRDVDYLLLLDADAVPALDVLERLAEAFEADPRGGVLGCKMLDRDVETIRHVGIRLAGNAMPSDIGRGEPDRDQYTGIAEADGVQTAAMAVRAELWHALGGLDERFEPPFFEGLDFCFRARKAGWRVAVACAATVTHFRPWTPRRAEPQSLAAFFRGRARFMCKHYAVGEWLGRYLPAEARWMGGFESKGMRRLAVRMLGQVLGEQGVRRPARG